jgi:hypothetical protein
MTLNQNTKTIRILLVGLLTGLFLLPVGLLAQNESTESGYYNPYQTKTKNTEKPKEKKYKSLPSSVFMTFHAGAVGDYGPKLFFNYKAPVFGLKIGTMKNTGWFLSLMTNFNFKGAFNALKETPVNIEKSSYSYFEGTLGLTGRYCKPVSFHFGAGYFCSTQNVKLSDGVWGHEKSGVKHGPVMTAGFMFHIRSFVLSLEAMCNYNIASMGKGFVFQTDRIGLGAKAGIGFCIPRKKKQVSSNGNSRDFLDGYGKDLRKQVPLSCVNR